MYILLLCGPPLDCCTASSKIHLSPFLKSNILKKALTHQSNPDMCVTWVYRTLHLDEH